MPVSRRLVRLWGGNLTRQESFTCLQGGALAIVVISGKAQSVFATSRCALLCVWDCFGKAGFPVIWERTLLFIILGAIIQRYARAAMPADLDIRAFPWLSRL